MSDASLAQLRAILSKCDFNQNELEKIVLLNDKIKAYGAYVAMSNSNDYFKIKNESDSEDVRKLVRETIFAWSDKYKLSIEKVDGKETFYITGRY
ncbi:hypothetical protein CGEO_1612 [Campylobacter geochelonis]|nr:hypothetical protein CGEO_1612 [Campylobacter geochelonis]